MKATQAEQVYRVGGGGGGGVLLWIFGGGMSLGFSNPDSCGLILGFHVTSPKF